MKRPRSNADETKELVNRLCSSQSVLPGLVSSRINSFVGTNDLGGGSELVEWMDLKLEEEWKEFFQGVLKPAAEKGASSVEWSDAKRNEYAISRRGDFFFVVADMARKHDILLEIRRHTHTRPPDWDDHMHPPDWDDLGDDVTHRLFFQWGLRDRAQGSAERLRLLVASKWDSEWLRYVEDVLAPAASAGKTYLEADPSDLTTFFLKEPLKHLPEDFEDQCHLLDQWNVAYLHEIARVAWRHGIAALVSTVESEGAPGYASVSIIFRWK